MTDQILEKIRKVLEKDNNIIFTILHGSYLEHRKFHDLDLAIYLKEDLKTQTENYYEIDLPIVLMDDIDIAIDISILNDSSLGFKYQTLKGKILICRDYEFYYEYAEEVLRYYLDYQPLLRKAMEDI